MRNALVFLVFFLSCSVFGQPQRVIIGQRPDTSGWPQPDVKPGRSQAEILAAIEQYAQKLVDTDHFSGVLLVAKDGKPVLSRAWGNANESAKNTLDTKFNIGSINKVFTKKAIEQLAAAGKLSMTDTIRKHLPDYPSAVADKITIRQLLDHKSGLGDHFGPKYTAAPPSRLRELSDFLPLFAGEPLQFEPGNGQRYSNAGYIVLGLIVERISGEKYRDYVRKNIFELAGMKNTGFWTVDEKVANRATGYTGSPRVANTATLPGRPSSAGGAYATAGDLLRFFQWTKVTGLGVGGGAPGLNAGVEVDDGWTVVAMANLDPPSAETLSRNAMAIVRGRSEPDGPMTRRGPSAPQKTELAAPIAVPLTQQQHMVVVEAKIDGKGPFKFAVDSGSAGMMRLTDDVAKELGLEEIGVAMSGDPSGKNMARRPVVRVKSVEIGGARFSGVDATVGGQRNVIGLALFSGLTATIDYPKMELRLSRDPLPATGEHIVAFTTERGVPHIDVDVAGVTLRADVDTGSPALLNVPPDSGVKFSGEPRVVGKGRTATNEFEIKAAELKGDLRVAGWSATAPMVDVVELFPVANVGSRFLRQYALTFDMVNKRLRLER